jgi:hypothetical protein
LLPRPNRFLSSPVKGIYAWIDHARRVPLLKLVFYSQLFLEVPAGFLPTPDLDPGGGFASEIGSFDFVAAMS